MSGAVYLCGTDDRCEKHNRPLHGYPCPDCQQEWAAANPLTAAAIDNYLAGRGSSLAAIHAARKVDRANYLQRHAREAE